MPFATLELAELLHGSEVAVDGTRDKFAAVNGRRNDAVIA